MKDLTDGRVLDGLLLLCCVALAITPPLVVVLVIALIRYRRAMG